MIRSTCLTIVTILLTLLSAAHGGETLVVCDDVRDPLTLDPQRQFSEKNHTILQQIYDGLVRFNPEGRIEPALAASWTRIDPLRVRFKLREGVRFHNGEPFNAEAVRFSIERYLDPRVDFPAVGFIDSIERAEVVDDHTVDIVTKYPDGLLLNRLAGFILIVPPRYVQEEGEKALHDHPVGTGAFRFERWDRGTDIRLEANPSYWLPDSPKIDRLVFRFTPAREQLDLLLKGEVDLITEMPGTMTTAVMASGRTRVVKRKTYWTVGATMRTDSGPLSDVRVRRALNLAIDRADLVRYDGRGNGSVLASLTMEGEEGHNPDLEPYPHDPEAARELLDEAGVQRPLVLKTLVRAQAERTAGILAAQLADVGVQLDIQMVSSDAEVIRSFQSEPWDIAIAGLPDPMCHSFFIQSILLYSESPFSLQNDPEVDRRLMEMAQTLDPEKRAKLGRTLDRYVHEQAMSLFTYQKVKTYGQRKRVRFTPYVSGMPYFFNTDMLPENARSATTTPPARTAADPVLAEGGGRHLEEGDH